MNLIHISRLACALAFCGCATRSPAGRADGNTHGTVPVGPSLQIDVGAANVRLRLESGRDSVSWSLRATPAGCAAIKTSLTSVTVPRNAQRCSSDLEIAVPPAIDVRVSASVGNVVVSVPDARSATLKAGVGRVTVHIDNRELRYGHNPGSGDTFEIGDAAARPRIDVVTGVGSITASFAVPSFQLSK